MENLPFTALRSIFIHIKASSTDSQKDLLACSLVNSTWHHAATPTLYGIVVLDIPRLATFTKGFNPEKYAKNVMSLTLRMEGDEEFFRQPTGEQAPHPILCERLRRFIPLLNVMTNLISFSCFQSRNIVCFLPRREIIDMLNALSASCMSLELDTQALDRRDKDTEPQETTHICDALRNILPQMQYVRIRTVAMCSSMFLETREQDPTWSRPLSLPKLRGMIINCGDSLSRCGPNDWFGSRAYQPGDAAWAPVTSGLAEVIDVGLQGRQEGHREASSWLGNPNEVTISVVATTKHSNDDMAIWQARIRADMIKKESWAIPMRTVWMESTIPGSLAICLPNGPEMLGSPAVVERLGEGEEVNWFALQSGARLPRPVMVGDRSPSLINELSGGLASVQPDEPPLKTPEQWRHDNPKKMSYHWRNEQITGVKLIKAERRVGKDAYLSLAPVTEITPSGWQRGFRNESLEPIG